MIAKAQYEDKASAGSYNVGPEKSDCITTGELVDLFCKEWGDISWENVSEQHAPHEAGLLTLDCTKIKTELGWKPKWNIRKAISETCAWEKARSSGCDMKQFSDQQINAYFSEV